MMRSVPFECPMNFSEDLLFRSEQEGYWYLFQGDSLLIHSKEQRIPSTSLLPLKRSIYLGMLDGKYIFAGEIDPQESIPLDWEWKDLRSLFGSLSDAHFAVAGRAMQLLHWDRVHKYCGCCGSPTFNRKEERCRECSSCGYLAFPKIAPVIMALITKGNQVLLARGAHFPEKIYSVLAGFVNPGETLEQCVAREVFEEVGIQIKNIQYFSSQPWPFSHSLMIGFTCEWESGVIQADPNEIADVGWFDISDLPELPDSLSLARLMIDSLFRPPD